MEFRTRSARERAEQYEREAEKFRKMAVAEPVGHIRQQLSELADQYQELALSLRKQPRF